MICALLLPYFGSSGLAVVLLDVRVALQTKAVFTSHNLMAIMGRSLMLSLVEPAPLYKAAILDAVAEMKAIGEWDISPDAFAARFDDMLREITAAKDPATAYF